VSFFLLNLLNLLNKFNKINRKNDTLNRPASESYLQSTLTLCKKVAPNSGGIAVFQIIEI
jgi:hypothetical protein